MSTKDQIKAIKQFIEWRTERNDVSGLEVSLDVYADWVAGEERRRLAQRGLDLLGQLDEGLDEAAIDEVRAALKAAL